MRAKFGVVALAVVVLGSVAHSQWVFEMTQAQYEYPPLYAINLAFNPHRYFTYYLNPNWWQYYAQKCQWYHGPSGVLYYGTPLLYVRFYLTPDGAIANTPVEFVPSPWAQWATRYRMELAWHQNAMWDEFVRRYAPLFHPRDWRIFQPWYRTMIVVGSAEMSFYAPYYALRYGRGW